MAVSPPLREWQQAALERFDATTSENFLLTATPGAGKTTFALEAARRMHPRVRAILIVVPTSNLRTQWARAAHRFGLDIDDRFTADAAALARDFHGAAVTYQAVMSNPLIYRRLAERAFVILDEVHHAGENRSWGDELRKACDPAMRRLLLSGTPFRSDNNPIPYVTYDRDSDGVHRSQADYTYGYGDGVKDSVVRPIAFPAFDGEGTWSDAGTVVNGLLSNEDETQAKRALKAALEPNGEWIGSVMRAADGELSRQREHTPDAGGLIVADNQDHARRYAELLEKITGEKVAVAISDEPDASKVIRDFTQAKSRWIIAVQMVSEGVDIPRLAVGVYASRTTTPLFFRQVAGRFVRTRSDDDETCAALYVPSIADLLKNAAEMETELDHALAEASEQQERDYNDGESGSLFSMVDPISSSAATHEKTILSGEDFTSAEIERARSVAVQVNLTKLSDAEMARLLRHVTPNDTTETASTEKPSSGASETRSERKSALRKAVQRKVSKLARHTGRQYNHIYAELNRECAEKGIDKATIETLYSRIQVLDRQLGETIERT
ncbi:superfamily II DNA or RNA helicase [Haloactinospora alba]|uniref:Superfamily II DNA or RNA helicase n=1 Tax=Haloactinospora alba TaxID=405555 RepID=A0A543N7H9_9ACTN|nr:DEAD/DEAH box helicase [Haloactinospora alba]TQN27795.1 superfamily II DNA or RNA helicase [Haloactinospora alba]